MNVRLESRVTPRYVYESVVVIGNDANVNVCRGGGAPLLLSSERGGRKKTTLVFLEEYVIFQHEAYEDITSKARCRGASPAVPDTVGNNAISSANSEVQIERGMPALIE